MPDEDMEVFEYEHHPHGADVDIDIDLTVGDTVPDSLGDFELEDAGALGDISEALAAPEDEHMPDPGAEHLDLGNFDEQPSAPIPQADAGVEYAEDVNILDHEYAGDLSNLGEISVDWKGEEDADGAPEQNEVAEQVDEIDYRDNELEADVAATKVPEPATGMGDSGVLLAAGVDETLGQDSIADGDLDEGGALHAEADDDEPEVNLNEVEGGPDADFEHLEAEEEEEEQEAEEAGTGEGAEEADDAEGDEAEDDEENEESPGSAEESSLDVVVYYLENEYNLFSEAADDDPNDFFLADKSVVSAPLTSFFTTLRDVISEEIPSQNELVVRVDGLGLEIGETMTKDFLSRTTFGDILGLHDMLLKNEDPTATKTLYLYLETRLSCTERFALLKDAANRGKGISEVAHYFNQKPSGLTNGMVAGVGVLPQSSKLGVQPAAAGEADDGEDYEEEDEDEEEEDEEEEEEEEDGDGAELENYPEESHPTTDSREEFVVEETGAAADEEELIDYDEDEDQGSEETNGKPTTGNSSSTIPCLNGDPWTCLCMSCCLYLLEVEGDKPAAVKNKSPEEQPATALTEVAEPAEVVKTWKQQTHKEAETLRAMLANSPISFHSLIPDQDVIDDTNIMRDEDAPANQTAPRNDGETADDQADDDYYGDFVEDEGVDQFDNAGYADADAADFALPAATTAQPQPTGTSKVTNSRLTSGTSTMNGDEEIGYDEDDQGDEDALGGAVVDLDGLDGNDEITWELDENDGEEVEAAELESKAAASPSGKRQRDDSEGPDEESDVKRRRSS